MAKSGREPKRRIGDDPFDDIIVEPLGDRDDDMAPKRLGGDPLQGVSQGRSGNETQDFAPVMVSITLPTDDGEPGKELDRTIPDASASGPVFEVVGPSLGTDGA